MYTPLAIFSSPVLEEKTRYPFSRAAEKQEQSALRETESTKGPLFESRIGRVFILCSVKGLVGGGGYLKAVWGVDGGCSGL